jgi:putative ABC transport system permease protein
MISPAWIAWFQLRRQKTRFAVAMAGVAFAVALMFMQLGFQDALFNSAVTVHRRLKGDLFLVHPQYNVIVRDTFFPRVRLYQALGMGGVAWVSPVYFGTAPWKNPETGRNWPIFILGIDPVVDLFDSPAVEAQRTVLRYPDVVLYDEYSRSEFGPIPAILRDHDRVVTEILNRTVVVRGLFQMGTSFGIDATILTSDLNFLRIMRHRTAEQVGIGVIGLKPGVSPEAVQTAMRAVLPHDVQVLTKPELLEQELTHWAQATPIGFVFTFGVVMGLVVGMIIVYQILFANISDHLKEYATLKAMGYGHRYLAGIVLCEATILACAGFVPGLLVCERLYAVARRATMLPMTIEPVRTAEVLLLTLGMCWASALIAVRKLRAADPADVF